MFRLCDNVGAETKRWYRCCKSEPVLGCTAWRLTKICLNMIVSRVQRGIEYGKKLWFDFFSTWIQDNQFVGGNLQQFGIKSKQSDHKVKFYLKKKIIIKIKGLIREQWQNLQEFGPLHLSSSLGNCRQLPPIKVWKLVMMVI